MPVSSIERTSGLQDALDVRPHVLGSDKFAPVGHRDAALHRLSETRIVVEKARDGFRSEFMDVASVAGRDCGKPGFLIGTEANFHDLRISIAARTVKSINDFDAVLPSRAQAVGWVSESTLLEEQRRTRNPPLLSRH